jgi:hypothetical protein
MSKQRPNPDKLANELAGASAFFRSTPPTQPEPEATETPSPAPNISAPIPDDPAISDVTTSRRHDTTTSSVPTSQSNTFDINRPTASRDSLRLSVEETKALDALRAALKWDYDLTVSKNDICRAALHWLLEDFAIKGDKSQAVARLKRKHISR